MSSSARMTGGDYLHFFRCGPLGEIVPDRSLNDHALCKTQIRIPQHTSRARACPLATWHSHRGRVGQLLRSHLRTLHPGSSKGGRPQLSTGRELAHAGAHPSAACWSMESPEREEPSGALLAFNREAHPHPLQEVSDASAPLSVPLKRRWECPLCSDKRTYHVNVRFVP